MLAHPPKALGPDKTRSSKGGNRFPGEVLHTYVAERDIWKNLVGF